MKNTNNAIIAVAGCGIVVSIFIFGYFKEKNKSVIELEKTKIIGKYPPEYWLAKKAKTESETEIKKAQIESEERLRIDERERRDQERAQTRAFEKDAPAEYWEQKRIEAEEKTKQELNKQRYESERLLAQQHQQAITSGLRATERLIRNNTGVSIGLV